MKLYQWLLALTASVLLAACGGGGGSAGASSSTSGSGTSSVSSSTPTTSTFVTPTVANITLTNFQASATSLASGANTSFSVTVLSNGGVPAAPVTVQFYAACGAINGQATSAASPISVVTNGLGVATADYSSVIVGGGLCSNAVTLFANASGATQTSLNLNVTPPAANSIQFISASPANIYVAGTGAVEKSEVTFRVFAANSQPLSGVTVTLTIASNPTNVGLGSAGATADVAKTSDANGEVKLDVFSGNAPTSVKVRDIIPSGVFADSQNLAVASGPPSQKFMSVSVEKFNIEGWAIDGTSTKITARVADRQGNAVQDGTVVNFTAEGGQIASSCATTRVANISSCSVDFISQNPRPAGGRVSILAYLEGTKDFVDIDGSNSFNVGDTLNDIGNAYRDDNEDGSYTPGEFRINRGGAVACAGQSGTFPAQSNTCDGLLATTVRQQVVILFSSSTPVLTDVTWDFESISATVRSADNPSLPMPVGTKIAAEVSGGTCAVDKQFGSPVVNIGPGTNPAADLSTTFQATLKTCAPGNVIFINVESPGGLKTTFGPFRIL
jgi:hypothetical protein